MFTYIKKKIIEITDRIITFFKENLAQIIFLVFLLQFLLSAKSMPYINLINNFEFYSIGFLLFLSMIIFRVIIPYRRTIQIVIALFVVAALATIVEQVAISDLIGFITFVLLSLIVGRQILREKDDLQKIKD